MSNTSTHVVPDTFIYSLDSKILKILLRDKTTRKNIIWATNEYSFLGKGFSADDEIVLSDIIGFASIIKPRVIKNKETKSNRIKGMAEVFTPSWICNLQNNQIDEDWFGKSNVFNKASENGWKTSNRIITFPKRLGKTWQDYVKSKRLEITCGEAPYLTSRYDMVTGKYIAVKDRIGLLDRKLRIVSENVDSENDWYQWAKIGVQSVYGYDWQGDNVLLARENLLFTVMEFFENKFQKSISNDYLIEISKVLAWNIFQMDGIKYVIPNSCKNDNNINTKDSYNDNAKCMGCIRNDNSRHNGIYSRTYDWIGNKSVEFYSFVKEK